MKRYFIIAIVLRSFVCFGQLPNSTESADLSNIYCKALDIYFSKTKAATSPIYVERETLTTERCPTTVNGIQVTYVNGDTLAQLLKKEESITVIRVIPLRVKAGDFYINIIPFKVTRDKKVTHYINSGGSSIHFTYSSEAKAFVFSDFKEGGI